ncbi:MAG: complex I subunit 4 family protein [bacterium]
MNFPILSFIIWSPIIGVILIWIFTDQERVAKKIAMVSTCIPFLLSIYLVFNFKVDAGYQFVEEAMWIKDFGVTYFLGIDGLNLSLVFLVSLMTFIVIFTLNNWSYRYKAFFCCVLVMEAGLLGVFLSLDLILFYIFWEAVLIPGYFLINIWGGENRGKASIKFLIYTMLGSLIMLIAILVIYFKSSLYTFSIPALMSAQFSPSFERFIFFLLLIGLAIKVPLFPFHSWQPDAYIEAPNPITVLFSGLLAKMGVYGFIRVGYSIVPKGGALFSFVICILAVITTIYANLCAAVQIDLKRMFAYSSLGHMGLIMLGIGALNRLGLEGTIFHMFVHGIVAGAIFLTIGMLNEMMGTIEIKKLRMIVHYIPTGAIILWFWMFASFGFPGTGAFIAELYILTGAFQTRAIFGIIAMISIIIMLGYIFSTLPRITFQGDRSKGSTPRSLVYNKKLVVSLISLAVIIIFLGFYPDLLMSRCHNYITLILGRIQP